MAMADPSNVFAIDDIRTLTGAEVRQVVATAESVTAAINTCHRRDSEAEHISAEASATSGADGNERLSNIKEVHEDAPIVRLVDLLISQAISDRGLGHPYRANRQRPPRPVPYRRRTPRDNAQPAQYPGRIISRLKVMADINIAERRSPRTGASA